MKKSSLILSIVILLITVKLSAQSFNATAKYSIKLAEDTFFFDGTLNINDKETLFSFKKNKKKKWLRENMQAFQSQVIYTDISGYQVYKKIASKKSLVRAFCRQKEAIIYEDKIELQWKLGNLEKEIGGLICRDASVTFRGREYEAWYTLAVPVSAGPWKFSGLPGLIVSVSDKTGEVAIFLKSLNQTSNENDIPKIAKGEKMTIIEFNECLDKAHTEKYYRNKAIIAKLQAQAPDIEMSDNNAPKYRINATELNFIKKHK